MDYHAVLKTESGFHIEGFPDAAKVLKLTDPKAMRIADLGLHQFDLEFSLACLDAINKAPKDSDIIRTALWQTAIVQFMKCFGDNASRFSLDARSVYKGDAQAFENFEYFKSLRHKNLIHDENSYTQCIPGAILNKEEHDCKIAKIICFTVVGSTLGLDQYSNLHKLVTKAQEWVTGQFDNLCNMLADELEALSYNELSSREGIEYVIPEVEDIHKKRSRI